MAELTKRGEEDREREQHEMTGEPVNTTKAANAGTPAGTTTRDKGVAPAEDDPGRTGHREGAT